MNLRKEERKIKLIMHIVLKKIANRKENINFYGEQLDCVHLLKKTLFKPFHPFN